MAQKKGFTVKMDNSDNELRKYSISCQVSVVDDKVTEVREIYATKGGVQVAHATFNRLTSEKPNISINVMELPLSEHQTCIAEIYEFVAQAVEEAV